jgi:hypothetical protein
LNENVLFVIFVSDSGAPVWPFNNETEVPSGKPLIIPEILNPSVFFWVTTLLVFGKTFAEDADFLLV